MEWYYTDWKERAHNAGLTIHRKILPEDSFFRNSVKIGREKILEANPGLVIHKLDMKYYENLKDAVEK